MVRPFLKYRLASSLWIVFLYFGTMHFLLAPQNEDIILWLGAVITGLFLAHWLIVLLDMSITPLGNKFFWIFSMFIFPPAAMILYFYKKRQVSNSSMH